MGAKRKVDETLYKRIKKELKTPKDDKKVMKKYHLGQTAIRAIRLSWCYADYLARTSHKKITLTSSRRHRAPLSAQERAFTAWQGFMMLTLLGMAVAVFLIIRWILSWFGI